MNWFRSILPNSIPAGYEKRGNLAILRERALQSAVIATWFFSLFLFGAIIVRSIASRNPAAAIFFFLLVSVFTWFVVQRDMEYRTRGFIFLAAIFVLGGWALLQTGMGGIGLVSLLAFVILAGLLGLFSPIIAFIIAAVVLLAAGALEVLGWSLPTLPVSLNNFTSIYFWLFILIFTLLASAVVMAMVSLLGGMQKAVVEQEDISQKMANQRTALELRIKERTDLLERRVIQLRTASEIARSISTVMEPTALLQQVADLIRERFDLYYVGIFLLDENHENAVLRAGTGEAGRKMIESGHRLPVGGTSMIGWATRNRQARIALDVGEEAVRFNNPFLPSTHSEMALPVIGRDEVIGAISIQSIAHNAFDSDDVLALQGIADSLGVALENARLFHQADENIKEIRTLNRSYLSQAWSEVVESFGEMDYEYENPAAPQTSNLHTLEIPVNLRDQTIGQIILETDHTELSKEEAAFIDAVTAQTALALESARLVEETKRRVSQEETINRITSHFSRAFTVDDILKSAVRELSLLPSVAEVSVELIPPEITAVTPLNSNGNGHSPANGSEASA